MRMVASVSYFFSILQMTLPMVSEAGAGISKVVDLGFLRRLKPAVGGGQDRGHYEVRRILRAFVDAQWLAEFDARLEVYRTALSAAPAESIDKAANKGAADA